MDDQIQISRWSELNRVDALPLSILTRQSVEAWKRDYVTRRKGGHDEKRRAKTTANAIIAKARSLFSDEKLELAGLEGRENPFEKVKLYPAASSRYISKLNVVDLIEKAQKELAAPLQPGEAVTQFEKRTGAFQFLIVVAFTGMRAKDADLLLWNQIDLEAGIIHIRRTEHFEPKTESSLREIRLDPDGIAFLRRFRKETPDAKFYLPGVPPRPEATYPFYRANRVRKFLLDWLRHYRDEKGDRPFSDPKIKALHVIRKEIGAMVASREGIFAASRFLGHSNINITNSHYADQKKTVTAGVTLRRGGDS